MKFFLGSNAIPPTACDGTKLVTNKYLVFDKDELFLTGMLLSFRTNRTFYRDN